MIKKNGDKKPICKKNNCYACKRANGQSIDKVAEKRLNQTTSCPKGTVNMVTMPRYVKSAQCNISSETE